MVCGVGGCRSPRSGENPLTLSGCWFSGLQDPEKRPSPTEILCLPFLQGLAYLQQQSPMVKTPKKEAAPPEGGQQVAVLRSGVAYPRLRTAQFWSCGFSVFYSCFTHLELPNVSFSATYHLRQNLEGNLTYFFCCSEVFPSPSLASYLISGRLRVALYQAVLQCQKLHPIWKRMTVRDHSRNPWGRGSDSGPELGRHCHTPHRIYSWRCPYVFFNEFARGGRSHHIIC